MGYALYLCLLLAPLPPSSPALPFWTHYFANSEPGLSSLSSSHLFPFRGLLTLSPPILLSHGPTDMASWDPLTALPSYRFPLLEGGTLDTVPSSSFPSMQSTPAFSYWLPWSPSHMNTFCALHFVLDAGQSGPLSGASPWYLFYLNNYI